MKLWILGALVSLPFLFIIILIFYRQKKRNLALYKSILLFLNQQEQQKLLPLSVQDNSFSLVENQIVALEEEILNYKQQLQSRQKDQAQWIIDITHQLKTPLAGLKLYCEMEEGTYQVKQLELVEHMEALLSSLIKLEKLYVNAYDFVFEPCIVKDIVQKAKMQLEELFPEQNITIQGDGELYADSYWLQEALMNVIKNACEHSHKNQLINVKMINAAETLTITVEDEGGGVAEDELTKLFNRFYKSSKNKNSQGVGVGLAIAKAIVEKHHGNIYAQNTLKGLKITMKFYLHTHLLTKL